MCSIYYLFNSISEELTIYVDKYSLLGVVRMFVIFELRHFCRLSCLIAVHMYPILQKSNKFWMVQIGIFVGYNEVLSSKLIRLSSVSCAIFPRPEESLTEILKAHLGDNSGLIWPRNHMQCTATLRTLE